MVGIDTHGLAFPDLDIFNCLALDPHNAPIVSFLWFCKRLIRISLKMHPDKLHGHPPSDGVRYSDMSPLVNTLKQYPARQNGAIDTINQRGKDVWVSTWSETDAPGSWTPLPSCTARITKKSAPKQPAQKPAHPAHESATPPAQSRTTQYTCKGEGEKFSTSWRRGESSTGPHTAAQSHRTKYSFRGNGEKFSTTRTSPHPAQKRTTRTNPCPAQKRTHSVIDSDDDLICEIDKEEFKQKQRRKTTKDDDDTICE